MKTLSKTFIFYFLFIFSSHGVVNLDDPMMTSSEENIDALIQERVLQFKSKTIPFEISVNSPGEYKIVVQGKNDACLELVTDFDEKNLGIWGIYIQENDCPFSGTEALELSEKIVRYLGLKTYNLEDDSKVLCRESGKEISLQKLKIFEKAQTWYESHGLRFENYDEYRAEMEDLHSINMDSIMGEHGENFAKRVEESASSWNKLLGEFEENLVEILEESDYFQNFLEKVTGSEFDQLKNREEQNYRFSRNILPSYIAYKFYQNELKENLLGKRLQEFKSVSTEEVTLPKFMSWLVKTNCDDYEKIDKIIFGSSTLTDSKYSFETSYQQVMSSVLSSSSFGYKECSHQGE